MVRTRQNGAARWMAVCWMAMLALPASLLAQQEPAAPAPAAPAAPATATAVLDMLPANAQLVVLVPSLSGFSQHLQQLNTAGGMNLPVLSDPLGDFKREMGMNKGVNDAGSMAVAVLDLHAAQEAEPPVLLFVPVTNYADFVSNYGSDKVEGTAELALPTGHTAFARKVGNFAVLSPQQAAVDAHQPGQAQEKYRALAGKLSSQYLDSSDIAVLLDVNALAPTLQPMLEEGRARMIQELQAQPQPNAAMARSVMQIYFDIAQAVLRDTNSAILGLDAREGGLGLTFGAQFKPGSELAKLFGNGNGGAAALLQQAPNQPYLIATATDFRGIELNMLLDKLDARLQDPAMAWMGQLLRDALPMLRGVKSMTQAYYVSAQIGLNANLFNGVTVMDVGQGGQFREALRSYVSKLDQMRIDMGPIPAADGRVQPAIMSFSSQYTDNALQVDGVAVDQYAVSYTLPPQMMQEMGRAGSLMMMMGVTNQSGYVAIKDQYAIITSTPDAQLLRATLATVKAGDGLSGQPAIDQINEHLTPKPSIVSYVSVAGIGQTVNQVMMMMYGVGQPLLDVPADLPPVGFSASLQDGGVAKRLFVPTQVISFVSQTAGQMMGQMQDPGAGAPMDQPPQGPPPAPLH